MDPEFLMDIMEINERLADAEDEKTVQEIRKKNNLIMENLLRYLKMYIFKKHRLIVSFLTACHVGLVVMRFVEQNFNTQQLMIQKPLHNIALHSS